VEPVKISLASALNFEINFEISGDNFEKKDLAHIHTFVFLQFELTRAETTGGPVYRPPSGDLYSPTGVSVFGSDFGGRVSIL
jgi:hypothetical protein